MDKKLVSVFAAGPINGARSCRLKVLTDIYRKLMVSIKVISPRSQPAIMENYLDKPVKVVVYNPQDILPKEEFTKDIHNSQIEWETKYLDESEVLLFYIPAQEEDVEGYAKTTRFELGEHISKIYMLSSFLYYSEVSSNIKKNGSLNHVLSNIKHLILYIDESFSGKYYIIKRIQDMCEVNKIFADHVHIAETHEQFISMSADIIKYKIIDNL